MCFHFSKKLTGHSVASIMGHIIFGFVMACLAGLVFGFGVKWLWNWLMPGIFGLTTITFWQAWGLVILSHILFKSFPHHHHDKHHQHHDEWKTKFEMKFHKHDHDKDMEEPETEKPS